MAIELEGLEFEITSSSSKAEKGLKGLHDTLVRIRNAVKNGLGLGNVVNEIDNVADEAAKKMKKLERACKSLTNNELRNNLLGLSVDFKLIGEAIDKIDVERVERLRNALKGMKNAKLPKVEIPTGGGVTVPAGDTPAAPVDSDVTDVGGQVEENTERVSRLHNVLSGLRGVFAKTFQTGAGTLRTFGKAVTKAWSGVKSLGKAAAVLPKRLGSGLAAKIKQTTSSLGQFFASIKRIAMYRLIRSALKAITQGFSEGIKNLYHWSDALGGTFAKSMDKLATDAQYLKNSLAAMAAPLINALAPAIDFITDKIVDFLNYVNQLIAKLTGASTYTVAKKVAAEWDDASKKTKKATDEIKRYTLGFDELNILGKKDKDTGSSSKQETDYSKMFETKQVDSSISDVTKKLQAMFGVLKQAWAQEGQATINAAKAAFGSFKDLISDIGDTFYRVFTNGYGFDWAVSSLKVLQSILGVVTTLNQTFKTAWDDNNRGYNYIASIFSMMSRVNDLLSNIATAFRNAWDSGIGVKIWSNILEIATGCNNIVGNLADSISRAWNKAGLGEKIWNGVLTIVNTVLTAVNKIVTATANWAADLNFEPILTAFNDLLAAINPVVEKVTNGLAWAYENVLLPVGKWTIEKGLPALMGFLSAAFGLLSSVLEGLKEPALYIWDNFLKPIGEWTGGVITTVLEKLTGVLKKLSDWIDTHKEAFDAIVDTVGAFVAGWLGAKAVIGIISGITQVGSLLVGGLGTLAGSFNPVVLAIEAVITIGVLLYQHWDEIKEAARKLGEKISEVWGNIKKWTSEKWESIKTTVTTTWENLKTGAAEKFEAIKSTVTTTWNNLKTGAIEKWNSIKTTVSEKWDALKKGATEKFDAIKNKISTTWETVKTGATTKWTTITTNLKNTWNTLKGNAQNIFKNIGGNITGAWDKAKKCFTDVIDWVNRTFSVDWDGAWTKIVSGFGTIFGDLKEKLKTPINGVIGFLNTLIGKVEGAINKIINGINSALTITTPKITLPFGAGTWGGWSWSPNLRGISWRRIEYLAAGGILNDPTLFGMLSGKPLMGGEAGREAVLPLETHTEWMDTLADKVRAGLPGMDEDLTESVRQGMSEATARQNDLLREQNNLLRQILDKDLTANVSFDDFTKAAQRKNRIYGTTVVPIG